MTSYDQFGYVTPTSSLGGVTVAPSQPNPLQAFYHRSVLMQHGYPSLHPQQLLPRPHGPLPLSSTPILMTTKNANEGREGINLVPWYGDEKGRRLGGHLSEGLAKAKVSTESGGVVVDGDGRQQMINLTPFHPTLQMATGGEEALRSLWSGGPLGCWPPYDPNMAAAFNFTTGGYVSLDVRRKNATRESTSTLKAWLYEHIKNPYPTKGEKIMLAIVTKMTLTQVSTWFANARRRLKKENKMQWTTSGGKGVDGDRDDDDDEVGSHGRDESRDEGHDDSMDESRDDRLDNRRDNTRDEKRDERRDECYDDIRDERRDDRRHNRRVRESSVESGRQEVWSGRGSGEQSSLNSSMNSTKEPDDLWRPPSQYPNYSTHSFHEELRLHARYTASRRQQAFSPPNPPNPSLPMPLSTRLVNFENHQSEELRASDMARHREVENLSIPIVVTPSKPIVLDLCDTDSYSTAVTSPRFNSAAMTSSTQLSDAQETRFASSQVKPRIWSLADVATSGISKKKSSQDKGMFPRKDGNALTRFDQSRKSDRAVVTVTQRFQPWMGKEIEDLEAYGVNNVTGADVNPVISDSPPKILASLPETPRKSSTTT